MKISDLQLNNFKDLFIGNQHNYGQHVYKFDEKGKKESGSNTTVTSKLLTIAQYREHLEGKIGLGVIPITEDSQCKFAVIDIDIYNKTFDSYLTAIEKHGFPLVPFYSKSGGLHLYTFFKATVRAIDAVKKMDQMARILGITLFVKQNKNEVLEIFPKQTKVAVGQVGNWINLPYFNADNTRQGLIKDDKMLSFNDALIHIKSKLTSIEEIDELIVDLPYADGPPCLQTLFLTSTVDKDNGRNNYLFSFGVYLKKKDENYFEQAVANVNNALKEPLEAKEIEATVLSSLRKKDYTYKCTSSPLCNVCDKVICQTKEYGIGKEGGLFSNLTFGQMIQYNTANPYYEWEIKINDNDAFTVLRFKNEDEIIKQDVFLRLCFRQIRFLPFKMKQVEWFKLVNQALVDIKVAAVAKEDDTSPLMRFHNLFYEFLTARAQATTKDQILAKRVYFDVEKRKYIFRTKDLVEYLYDYKNFRLFNSSEIHGLLRDMGVNNITIRTESKKLVRVTDIFQNKINMETFLEQENFPVDFSSYENEEQDF